MRSLFFILAIIFIPNYAAAQKTYRLDATKATNYGVTYSLPTTAIEVTIEYEIISKTAGPFHHFAKGFLNISNAIAENSIEYKLNGIKAEVIGVPDANNSFFVEFTPNSAASFITLTQDGLICAINDTYVFNEEKRFTPATTDEYIYTPSVTDGNKYLTEDILLAGTTAKQAELTAKQIYTLRENRNDILAGEVDNIPKEAGAFKLLMNKIDEQEKALVTMFSGAETIEKVSKKIIVDIKNRNINNRVIARFSKRLGLVKNNNYAGEPIYMNLTATTSSSITDPDTDPKVTLAFEKKIAKGIVYNIPGKAQLEIEYKNKWYIDKTIDVVQFGSKDVLDQKVFGNRNNSLKVIFYPHLGAIKATGTTE